MDVISIFEDISSDQTNSREEGGGTDIGQALQLVVGEIDDIAKATFSSITIDTLLKTMRWRERADDPTEAV